MCFKIAGATDDTRWIILAFSLPLTTGMEKKDALRRVYKLAAGIGAGEEVCRATDRSALCAVAQLRPSSGAETQGGFTSLQLLESLFRDFKSALDDSVELIDAEIPGSSEVCARMHGAAADNACLHAA
jgi:hypothetical protein